MRACTAGNYCPTDYMSAVDTSLECLQGFYCSGGAMKPTPGGPFNSMTDALNSGGICPMGKFCETGVAIGSNCGQNKFLPFYGAIAETDC